MSASDDELYPLHDYDNPVVPIWIRHEKLLAPLGVFISTVLLTVFAFPPFDAPEFAYMCCAPAILWAYRWPGFKVFAGVTIGAQIVAWYILTWWLHHATWPGFILLGPVIGAWVGSWFLIAWWVVPRLRGLPNMTRLFGMLALASAWVLIEWTRTWFLTGFPWLPLSASQWERSSILQVASFTGAGGISFALMLMNIGFAAYGHRLLFEKNLTGIKKRSQEFFLAVFGLLVCLSIHVQESVNRFHFTEPLGRFGFVQPNVPQQAKWDPSQSVAIVETLQQATQAAAKRRPSLILWPEAVTPWAVRGDETVEAFVEDTAMRAGVPILMGSIAIEPPKEGDVDDRWYNGVFLVDPETGVNETYYAKRHLVPFGEYVPLRALLGWLDKLVPIGGDFQTGKGAQTMLLSVGQQLMVVGPLICFEDTFPELARSSVRSGADLLVVFTNNGWFGESGAAEQHAAHSVLRAVETRRPVLRIGNAGWSGWIDEFGVVRAVFQKITRIDTRGVARHRVSTDKNEENGTIYFRGSGTVDVTRDTRWVGRESFFVEHGNWFVLVCAGLFGFGLLLVKTGKPKPEPKLPVED